MRKILIVGLMMVLGFGITAQSQNPQNRRMQQNQEKRQVPEQLLEKFDTNGDKVLNIEERQAMREAMQARLDERNGLRGPRGPRGPRGEAQVARKGPGGQRGAANVERENKKQNRVEGKVEKKQRNKKEQRACPKCK